MSSTGNARGRLESAAFALMRCKVKQFLIVKTVEGLNHVVNWIVVPGLYTLEAAQQFVVRATEADPVSRFLIQEVGAA